MEQLNNYMESQPGAGTSRKIRFANGHRGSSFGLPMDLAGGDQRRRDSGAGSPSFSRGGTSFKHQQSGTSVRSAIAAATVDGDDLFETSSSHRQFPSISASVKNQAPFSSKQNISWRNEEDEVGFESAAISRQASHVSLNKSSSLKLLHKAKISYREVMES
jgi:hypothetical protein